MFKYYFVSHVIDFHTGGFAFGNALIYSNKHLSLNEMVEVVKKDKSNTKNVVILNVKFLTEEEYKILKGENNETD